MPKAKKKTCKRKAKKTTKKKKPAKKKTTKKKTIKKSEKGFFEKFFEKLKKRKVEEKKEVKEIKKPHFIKTVLVKDLMVRNPITVNIKDTIADAFELIDKYKVDGVIVVENKQPIGVICDSNILELFSNWINLEKGAIEENKEKLEKLSKQPVSIAMIKLHEFLEPHEPVENAIKKMQMLKVKILPVVENNKLVGAILEDDILAYINRKIEEEKIMEEEVMETGIDKLYELILERKQITATEAAKLLKINTATVEKWARILQDHGLIEIDFSTVGTIKLIKKE